MKARAWALTAGLLLFSLFAGQCPAAESMRHRDWSSLVADDGGVPRARIVSQAQSDGDAFMMLDFDADGRYLARIMVKAPGSLRAGLHPRRKGLCHAGARGQVSRVP